MTTINKPSSDSNTEEYCFQIPKLPYIRYSTNEAQPIDPSHPPICFKKDTQLTEEHLKDVTDICKSYANCEYKLCKSFIQGHAVMCPSEESYTNFCLYDWATKGIGSADEINFIKTGQQFLKINPQTVSQCQYELHEAAANHISLQ